MLCLPVLSGCTQINMNRVAYELLRQEDCRRNDLEEFCTRTFANEYLEYERLRQDYIRSQDESANWRITKSNAT